MVTFSLLSARSMSKCFADLHCENLLELQEIKVVKIWEPTSDQVPLNFTHSDLCTLSLWQFVNYRLSFLSIGSLEVSALGFLVGCDSLYSPLCLSSFGDSQHLA